MASENSAIARYWPVANLGAFVVVCSGYWLTKLNNHVLEPYMDEIFHVPQAQQYCSGNYFDWDPKLTTPPGLYALSLLVKSVLPLPFWPGKEAPRDSRPFYEKEGVDVLSKAAETIFKPGCHITELRSIGILTLGLTFLVCWQIRRTVQPNTNSRSGDNGWWVLSEPAATAANICMFPLLFFFSGLYYTDVLSTFVVLLAYWAHLWRTRAVMSREHNLLSGVVVYAIGVLALTMRQTNIFWVGIFLAGLEWESSCRQIAPVAKLNQHDQRRDEVDKSWLDWNLSEYTQHAANCLHTSVVSTASPFDSIHCLLSMGMTAISDPSLVISRLWPYISLITTFVAFVFWNGGVVLGDKSNHVATVHLPQLLYLLAFTAFFSFPLFLPTILRLFNAVKARQLLPVSTIVWLLIATLAALASVHFNTIIHSFTLADNRHYMFYIFRYTILRHPLIKYLLCPLYVLAGWSFISTLGGQSTIHEKKASKGGRAARARPPSGPTTAFATIFLLTTTLSLITAPLVEPRYFIIPWVMWRLNIASYPASQEKIMTWTERMWYLAINIATCWIFLNKPFEWPSEPGVSQRFMW